MVCETIIAHLFQVGKRSDVQLPEANSIVQCCQTYQHKMKNSSGLLLLFTNDVLLSYMATSSRVHSVNRKVLYIWERGS